MGFWDFWRSEWSIEAVEVPWVRSREATSQYLSRHLREDGKGLRAEGERLPDEKPSDDTQVTWASGALDGVATHHGGWAGGSEKAALVLDALLAVLAQSNRARVGSLYALLQEEGAVSLVDPVLEMIRAAAKAKRLDTTRLFRLAHWMARQAPDREPVKFAMAILGMFTGPDHQETLRILGRHDEFTLYAAVAMGNTFEDPEVALWDLAQGVRGWGRVHAVERLAKLATRPEVKHWLLTEGHHNEVMADYLAFPCATGGDLHGALKSERPPEDVMIGAAEILDTLTAGEGGPFQGLEILPEGPEIVGRYLEQVEAGGASVVHYVTTHALRLWAESESAEDGAEPEAGSAWPKEARASLLPACQRILGNPAWRPRIEAGLAAEDKVVFAQAVRAAGFMALDVWPIHMERLQSGKGDDWWSAARTEDADRMAQVVALAEARLPLAKLATGPDVKLWGGPLSREFNALDFIVQSLGPFPGMGWPLIKTALQSPVIRLRTMAVKALKAWGPSQWPEEARVVMAQAMAGEPHEEVRKSLEDLLLLAIAP